MAAEIHAVTFDYWNTLVYEERGQIRGLRIAAWAGLLEDAGYPVERQALDAAMDRTWDAYVAHWTANEQFGAAQAAEQALEDLGFTPPPDVREALITAFADVGGQADLHTTDGARHALASLKAHGIRIGIVSDVGMTPSRALREHLRRHGLLRYFDHWSFSDEVGAFKPSPVIFRHALDGLEATPEMSAHVGDIRRTDMAGACDMGMLAIRFCGIDDDHDETQPEGDLVLRDLHDLPRLLGLSG